MLPDSSSLNRFIERLPILFASDTIRIETVKFPGRSENNWDMPARKEMMKKFSFWLKKEFGLVTTDVEKILFVEGLLGKLSAEAKGDFFGSVCCPDLSLKSIDGYLIAIELDHGSSGAKLRDALTKASFNVITGGFNLSIVLFFVDLSDKQQRENKFDPNNKILKYFKDELSTSVIFVTNYVPSRQLSSKG
jgi:hypothetical protein